MESPRANPVFDPAAVLSALLEHDVRVIVVGALAAELRGIQGLATRDLDLTPDLGASNLQTLAEVLHALGATVRTESHAVGPVPLPADGRLLARVPILNLHVPGSGDVDLIHAAAGLDDDSELLDYERLIGRATVQRLPGTDLSVAVMSEEDWIEAKRRPPVREKDRAHIAVYERWRASRGGG